MSSEASGKKTCDDDAVTSSSTIRMLLGSDAQIFRLGDYIRAIAPELEFDFNANPSLAKRLSETLVSPLDPNETKRRFSTNKASRQSSLSNIVDDVIWTLVNKQQRGAEKNMLSLGYLPSSEMLETEVTSCPNMRPGVICTRVNGNAHFCRKSKLFKVLHEMIGDDLMRFLLLKTSIFVPIDKEEGEAGRQTNYMLVCGPMKHSYKASTNLGSIAARESGPQLESTANNPTEGRRQESHLKPQAPINRQSLFRSDAYVPKVGLPKNHVLNQAVPDEQQLLSRMIPLTDTPSGRRRKKLWKRLRVSGLTICKGILLNRKKCDFHRLIDRHCPLPHYLAGKKNKGEEIMTPRDVSGSYTKPDNVVAFLSSCLRITFPKEFWGSSHNVDKFLGVVETFVKLRRREELHNTTIMNGIRINDFKWLFGEDSTLTQKHRGKLTRAAHLATTRLVTTVLRWVFNGFIIPLLRTNFTCTVTEFTGNRVQYYRKPVWALFRSLSLNHLLDKQYTEISPADVRKRLQNQRTGCSALRLVPKKTGVRPIATLCKRDISILAEGDLRGNAGESSHRNQPAETPHKRRKLYHRGGRQPSTNEILRDSFATLKFEHQNNPSLFGAGILGLHAFYPRWQEFVSKIKIGQNTLSAGDEPTKLYFVSVDIRHCYDTMNQGRLMEILNNVVSSEKYVIQRRSMLHSLPRKNRMAKKPLLQVDPLNALDTRHSTRSFCKHDGVVLLDEGNSTTANKPDILELIQEHLQSHIVVARGRHGSIYLLQEKGIPQGGILSCFLCNFYYGALEKELYDCDSQNDLANGHMFMLARVIDDYLLVTTDESMHRAFLESMREGKPALGVTINREKIYSNVSVSLPSEDGTSDQIERESIGCDGWFPWCGLHFDTLTCEVKLDLSRVAGTKAADSLTVARAMNPGAQLRNTMKTFVRPRCFPVLFDPSINCQKTIDTNFFDLMLICAVKTEAYIASSNMLASTNKNVEFVLSCIHQTVLFTLQLMKYRVSAMCTRPGKRSNLDVTKRLALSLGWNAFHIVFCRRGYGWNFLARIKNRLRGYPQGTRIGDVLRTCMLRDQPGILFEAKCD